MAKGCTYKYKDGWYTEEQLMALPEFKGHSPVLEREYVNNSSGENSNSQIEFFSPATESGIFTKFIQFKKGQLADLKQRLGKIEVAKKKRGVIAEELVKLNTLEREIKLHTEGNFELGIKGLAQEIAELESNASVDAVGFYAEKDLSRLAILAGSDNIDDLREAEKIIDFYTLAGTFDWNKKDDNPFFTREEIFLNDEHGNLVPEFRLSNDTMQQFVNWADRAALSKNMVDKKGEEITTNIVNSDSAVKNTYKGKQFSFEEITNTDKGLKDADWISMWTMDITQGVFSHNGIIPQVMFSYLVNNFEKKLAWARGIEEKIDKMNPGVQTELIKLGYSLRAGGIKGLKGASYQLFKEITREGNETGGLIQRFVKEFFDAQSKALNRFSNEFGSAKLQTDYAVKSRAFNRAFENLKQWRRANTIILDGAKIPELNKTSTPEAEAYKQYLISILGEKGYSEQVERQKTLVTKYHSDRQSMLETLLVQEGVADEKDLSEKSKSDLQYWEINHSPQRGVDDYYNVAGISFSGRKTNSFMDYNVFIPRKFAATVANDIQTGKYIFSDTNKPTGHYSEAFSTIESNPILSEFYDVIKEVCDTIREHTPYELQQRMAANVLPALRKTSTEMIADKNTGILSAIFLAYKNLMERIRLSFGINKQSEISYAILDAVTGKPNYRVNDQFLRNNSRSVQERMLIERTKFIQLYNTSVPQSEKLSNLRRFSVIPISRMNTASLLELAKYLNIDISASEVAAGNISKITTITGENVEIGKYIRDYSLHNVVQSQSFDLAKIGKYFSNMTMAYAAREEALPILEIMKKHYENIQTPKTNNIGKEVYNANSEKFEMTGVRTNANKQMDDWFERVALDNYGIEHWGLHGKETQETKDEQGNFKTKIPFYGKRIYSDEEKAKIKEINKLLSKETDEATIKRLQDLKANFGKERTATAIIDNILTWVRTLRLGYNVSSGITNLAEGITSNMILAAQSEYFDPKEIYYGYGVIKHSFMKNITFGLAETGLARKNRKLMDKFNVIMDSKNELQKSSHKTYASKLSWMNPHELNQRIEYINQSPIMIAMLRTLRIKDSQGNESSVWDAMGSNGHLKEAFRTEDNIENWENLSGQDYLTFKQKLHKVIVLGHGNYDELRGMMIKSKTAGKAVMMFKTWLPMQLYWRFATEQDDLQAGTVGFKGRYLSYNAGSAAVHGAAIGTILFGPVGFGVGAALGGFLGKAGGTDTGVGFLQESVEATKQLAKKMLGMPVNLITGILTGKKFINEGDKAFDKWVNKGDFTAQDARNMRANITDISIQLALLAMILMTKAILWDDDDKPENKERRLHNIIVNRLMTLSSQGAMYVNPVDTWKNTLGSVAIVQFLEDVGKEVKRTNDALNGDDIIQSGTNRGKSGLLIQTKKLIMPGLFKDNMFGFDTQADKVFEETPFHEYFKTDATQDKEDNKRERAARVLDLKEQGITDPKEIKKIIDEELPTPARLKKMGLTRDEFEEQQQQPNQ